MAVIASRWKFSGRETNCDTQPGADLRTCRVFFCAASLTIAFSFILYGIAQITCPSFTLSGYRFERHADATANLELKFAEAPDSIRLKYAEMSLEMLETERKQSLERHIAIECQDGYQGILRCGIIFAVFTCAFLLHWRLSRRQLAEAD